jgi:hypothetical protein
MYVIYFEIGDKTCQIPKVKSRRKYWGQLKDFLKYKLSLLIRRPKLQTMFFSVLYLILL